MNIGIERMSNDTCPDPDLSMLPSLQKKHNLNTAFMKL